MRKEIQGLTRSIGSKTKASLSFENLRGYKIDYVFVKAMNEAESGMRELIEQYRESRKAEDEMIYQIQKKLLNA